MTLILFPWTVEKHSIGQNLIFSYLRVGLVTLVPGFGHITLLFITLVLVLCCNFARLSDKIRRIP